MVRQGATVFLCGMARGCDFYFAETVLKLRETNPELQLIAALPCAGQADLWPAEDRARYRALCERCDDVFLLQDAYSSDCMRLRNQWMIDRADCLMTVFDGGPGGTGWTVRAARRKGIPILALWL